MPRSENRDRRVRRHVIGKEHDFFGVVPPGFEETARDELRELGVAASAEAVEGGVEFAARLEGCYRVNLASRTVTRLLMRLDTFKAADFGRLKAKVAAIPWELHLSSDTALALRLTARKSRLNLISRIEETIRGAVAERLESHGVEIAVASGAPAQKVYVRFFEDRATVSLDTSGEPLYLRGRKPAATRASLRETHAALILREAGWPDYDRLVDPMCGSGTFSLEAGEMAAGRMANPDRDFPFQRWPAFRPAAFEHLRAKLGEEAARATTAGKRILASDIAPRAVEAAKRNLSAALPAGMFEVARTDFLEAGAAAIPEEGRTLVVLNPPWGKRFAAEDVRRTYRRIGEILRERPRAGFAVLVPGLDLEKVLSVGWDKKVLFRNGGLGVALLVRRVAPEGGAP